MKHGSGGMVVHAALLLGGSTFHGCRVWQHAVSGCLQEYNALCLKWRLFQKSTEAVCAG